MLAIECPLGRAWDAWQVERYQRGETAQRPGYTDNLFRPRHAPGWPEVGAGFFIIAVALWINFMNHRVGEILGVDRRPEFARRLRMSQRLGAGFFIALGVYEAVRGIVHLL